MLFPLPFHEPCYASNKGKDHHSSHTSPHTKVLHHCLAFLRRRKSRSDSDDMEKKDPVIAAQPSHAGEGDVSSTPSPKKRVHFEDDIEDLWETTSSSQKSVHEHPDEEECRALGLLDLGKVDETSDNEPAHRKPAYTAARTGENKSEKKKPGVLKKAIKTVWTASLDSSGIALPRKAEPGVFMDRTIGVATSDFRVPSPPGNPSERTSSATHHTSRQERSSRRDTSKVRTSEKTHAHAEFAPLPLPDKPLPPLPGQRPAQRSQHRQLRSSGGETRHAGERHASGRTHHKRSPTDSELPRRLPRSQSPHQTTGQAQDHKRITGLLDQMRPPQRNPTERQHPTGGAPHTLEDVAPWIQTAGERHAIERTYLHKRFPTDSELPRLPRSQPPYHATEQAQDRKRISGLMDQMRPPQRNPTEHQPPAGGAPASVEDVAPWIQMAGERDAGERHTSEQHAGERYAIERTYLHRRSPSDHELPSLPRSQSPHHATGQAQDRKRISGLLDQMRPPQRNPTIRQPSPGGVPHSLEDVAPWIQTEHRNSSTDQNRQ